MVDTNIANTDNTIAMPEKLTAAEQKRLRSAVTGYRKMKSAVIKIGQIGFKINRSTIYQAMAGMNITPETAAKLRAFLNTLS